MIAGPPAKRGSGKLTVLFLVVLGLVVSGIAVYTVKRLLPGAPTKPAADDLALEAEAKRDEVEIAAVLKRYAAAYDAGDLPAITAVRHFDAKEQDKLQNILDTAKGKGYALQNCSRPQISKITATVSCMEVFTKASDSKPQKVNFLLRRINGQWTIVSSS